MFIIIINYSQPLNTCRCKSELRTSGYSANAVTKLLINSDVIELVFKLNFKTVKG
jgi:hypothetical protein